MAVSKNNYTQNSIKYMIYGNTAYDYEKHKKYHEYVRTKEDIQKSLKKRYKKKLEKRLKLIALVLFMFSFGILIIGRYVMIMNLNNQCRDIKTKIVESQKENENLKLQLMKYYDIKQIEKFASEELKMERPDTSNTVHINVSKGLSDTQADNEQPKKDNFIERLFGFFN